MPITPALTVARYAADTTVDDRAWMPHGTCAGDADPDAWTPTDEDTDDLQTRRALRACQHCPVAQECRDYALTRPWITGIWGATTTTDRAILRRNRRKRKTA